MKALITILTTANSITLLYVFVLKRIEIQRSTVYGDPRVIAFNFYWQVRTNGSYAKRFLSIPIRNARKVELQAERQRLMDMDYQQRKQTLRAKFSWIKTSEEAKVFQKDYGCVDKEVVNGLVQEFIANL